MGYINITSISNRFFFFRPPCSISSWLRLTPKVSNRFGFVSPRRRRPPNRQDVVAQVLTGRYAPLPSFRGAELSEVSWSRRQQRMGGGKTGRPLYKLPKNSTCFFLFHSEDYWSFSESSTWRMGSQENIPVNQNIFAPERRGGWFR